jgi:hypothetical protein
MMYERATNMNHGPSDGFLQAVTYSGETYRVPLLAEAQPGPQVFEGGGVPPPASASTPGVATGLPSGPFGALVFALPGGPQFSYRFTPSDVVWTARFIVGEAGGRNDPGNQAVIWAMFNRYALFTHRYYPTFHQFIRAYSTPLQPSLKSAGAAKRHVNSPSFVRTGGIYPGTDIPRGQLRRFLELQARPWGALPTAARALALQALTGMVPNLIGNASEFASTRVFFHDATGRYPHSYDEWRQFTEQYARRQKRVWVGPIQGLDQMSNAFFIDNRATNLPRGAIRVVP